MSNIENLTEKTFDEKIATGKNLVDFWATWCGPCVAMAPILNKFDAENTSSISVKKVDVDDNQNLAAKYGISSIPTMILFEDGKEVKRVIGARPYADLVHQLS